MVIVGYIIAFMVLAFLIFFWRKKYANRDSKSDNIKPKKEQYNPEFSSDAENSEDLNDNKKE